MMRSFAVALATALLLPVTSSLATAADLTLKFSHEVPDTAIKGQSAIKFAEAVEKNSNGSIEIAVYPGGQLVAPKEEIRAAVRGQIDIIAPLINYYSSINSDWDIFYQPLLFDTFEHALKSFQGELGQILVDSLNESGLVGMGVFHDGPFFLFTKDTKIVKPADLAGKKIRVPPSKPLESMLQKVGAHPIGMPASEVYLALQQGVIDGVVTSATYAAPAKWSEVLGHMTKIQIALGGYGIAISEVTWNKLTDEQKDIVKKSMDEAIAWNHSAALENILNSINTLEKEGVEITEISEADMAEWKKIAAEVHKEQPENIQKLIAIAESNR